MWTKSRKYIPHQVPWDKQYCLHVRCKTMVKKEMFSTLTCFVWIFSSGKKQILSNTGFTSIPIRWEVFINQHPIAPLRHSHQLNHHPPSSFPILPERCATRGTKEPNCSLSRTCVQLQNGKNCIMPHYVNKGVLHMCINTLISFVIVVVRLLNYWLFSELTYWPCNEDDGSICWYINDTWGKGHHHQTV